MSFEEATTAYSVNGGMKVMYRFSPEKNEQIRKKGLAGLHIDDATLSGALYLTNERLIFVGYIHGVPYKNERVVPLKQIIEIKGGKTFFIIPTALNIMTDSHEHFRFVVRGRDEWLSAIRNEMAMAGHKQEEGT